MNSRIKNTNDNHSKFFVGLPDAKQLKYTGSIKVGDQNEIKIF